MKYISYDNAKFNFAALYESVIGIAPLHSLHTSELNTYNTILERKHDQHTVFHRTYYDNFESIFKPVYDQFIKEVIRPVYDSSIVYQTIPTFRVHLNGNIAVGEYHKDKWYRDEQWHTDVQEDNFFLPFTDAFGNNTIWAETQEDKGDFTPIECKYGQVVQWNGTNLTHGNKTNDTDHTRVSFDFRVMKFANYRPSTKGSINMNTKFQIGDYYTLLD